MGLNLWMPMNGDLHNQGLTNLTVTNTNATINNNGKIGKCYKFAKNAYINIPKEAMTSCTTQASVTLWVKINSWNTNWDTFFQAGLGSTPWTSYTFGLLRNSGNYLTFCISDGSSATQASCKTSNLTLGTWYHIAMVYYTGHILIYVNGSLVQDYATSITPNFNGITSIKLGGLASAYLSDCLLNDVRIYDHALSAKEVEEIAKGLVLHYKLDNNNEDLNWLLPNDERTIVRASSNTFIDYEYFNDLISCSETNYVVEFDAKGSVSNMKIDVYFRNSSGAAYAVTNAQILTTEWVHYSLSLSGSPANLVLFRARCYGGTANDYISLKNMKLTSNNMPLRNNTIYDSSGYQNNGHISGTININPNGPKYSSFSQLSAATTISHSRCLDNSNQEWTCVAWVKPAAIGNYQNLNNFNSNNRLYHGTYPLLYLNSGTNDYYNYGNMALPANEWSHIAFVFKNSTGTKLIYINGENHTNMNGPNKTSTPAGIPDTVIIGGSYEGGLCDYREYVTALTEAQIKELYHTSMSIDDEGNIYTRELVEL